MIATIFILKWGLLIFKMNYKRSLKILHFGLLVQIVDLKTDVRPKYTIRPFGPKMCEELCRRIGGCTFYTMSSNLTCELGTDNGVMTEGKQMFHLKDKHPLDRCADGSQLIISRAGKPKCVKSDRYGESLKTQNLARQQNLQKQPIPKGNKVPSRAHPIRSHLLLVPSKPLKPISHLNIYNNSVQTYPNMGIQGINAVCFVPSTREILVGANLGLYSSPLYRQEPKRIRTGVRVDFVVVDDEEGLFFISSKSDIYISSIKPVHLIEIQTTSKEDKRQLAVDTEQRRVLYVMTSTKLMSFSYNGSLLDTLHEGKYMRSLTIDPVTNILYFNTYSDILMTPLTSSNTSKLFKKIPNFSYRITAYDNRLFVIHYGGLLFYDNKSLIPLFREGDKPLLCMCLLP